MSPSDSLLPSKLSGRQFSIKLCFAMTINKAQGQSINNLGVYLPQPVFSHGLLYVALSRAGIPHKNKVMITNIKDKQGSFENYDGIYTNNVVYTENFH